MNRLSRAVLFVFVTGGVSACASRNFVVADSDLYTDGASVGAKQIQLVESQATTKYLQPAAETFEQNCREAETKALARFQALHPKAKDTGVRAGTRFDKNGGCTVRMVFAHE